MRVYIFSPKALEGGREALFFASTTNSKQEITPKAVGENVAKRSV